MSTPTNPTAGKPKDAPAATAKKTDLPALVNTLQFAWFVGHVVTVLSVMFYVLTYLRIMPKTYKFWYKLALLGVIESFGVLIFQSVKKNGANAKLLLKDDNVQYLLLAAVLFVYSPYVLLTLSTFALFSTFHVLSYLKNYLLPAANIPDSHPLSTQIGNFITANNNKSISLACLLEVYTVGWLFVRVLTFRPTSLVPFLVYVIFIKLRFEKSSFTRSAFKSVEIKAESLVNLTGHPVAKDLWVKVKLAFHKVASISLVNDYSKDKSI